MASVACSPSSQTLSLLECFCFSPLFRGRARQPFLYNRFCLKLGSSQLPQSRALSISAAALSSSTGQVGTRKQPKLSKSGCDNQLQDGTAAKLEIDTAPRKVRNKRAPRAFLNEHEEVPEKNSNGVIKSTTEEDPESLLVVRNVLNAEDTSDEISNDPKSEDRSKSGLSAKTRSRKRTKVSKVNSGGMPLQAESFESPSTDVEEDVLAVQVDSSLGSNTQYKETNQSAGTSNINNTSTCQSKLASSTVHSNKKKSTKKKSSRGLKKAKDNVVPEDQHSDLDQVMSLSQSSDSLADGCSLQDDANFVIESDRAIKLEYDAKIGGDVVDVTDYRGNVPSLQSQSSLDGLHSSDNRKVRLRKKRDKKQTNIKDKMIEPTVSNDVSSLSEEPETKNITGQVRDTSDFDGQVVHGQAEENDRGDSQQTKGKKDKSTRIPRRSRRLKKNKMDDVELNRNQDESSDALEPRKDYCTVKWLVEAFIAANQKLFLVGEDSYLGSWDPNAAITFSECEKGGVSKIWKAEVQVPFGTHSDYNYFIQVSDGRNDHIIWRPGPKLCLSVPLQEDLKNQEIILEENLGFIVANKLPSLLWKGLSNEIGFPDELRRFLPAQTDYEDLESPSLPIEDGVHKMNIGTSKDELKADTKVQDSKIQPTKEPKRSSLKVQPKKDNVVVEALSSEENNRTSSIVNENVTPIGKAAEDQNLAPVRLTPKLKKYIRKRVFPREEPWLMESMILQEKVNSFKMSSVSSAEGDQEVEGDKPSQENNPLSLPSPEEKAEVLTEILISSSKCTMERIAILENGKLVELLLEPVNSDINVGNVYLGVVRKLLPGMTGVFVDIGHPRVALLTITKNVYPYTFPPIVASEYSTDTYTDGSESGKPAEISQPLEKFDHLEEDWETDEEDNEEEELEVEELACNQGTSDSSNEVDITQKSEDRKLLQVSASAPRPITVNFGQRFTKWRKVEEGMRIIVQVKREPLGKKGPKVCAFPHLSSRFWVLGIGGKSTGVSKKIIGAERKRLKEIADSFRQPGFDLTVRTEAAGQSQDDLEKDLTRLMRTWKDIMEQAEAASLAADNGQDGAVPTLLHRAMGQTLSIVRDFFAEKVHRMVVDSAQTYHEVISYLQEVAPQLLNRVELYTGTMPIFDAFNLEVEIDRLLNERVQLPNGAYLVIQQTEALVSIDVNGGTGMLGKSMKADAILEANLAAARQIAVELRLRDVGGIIVVDFIDMEDDEHEMLVYQEMRNAIQSDRSVIHISEISDLGLMELTRRRVRPSVTFMISDPCPCCRGSGRVEALETTFSKIERAILRLVATHSENIHFNGRMWKKVLLRVDPVMFDFLTRKQRAAQLSSSFKVYIILKVGKEMSRGSFELTELTVAGDKKLSTGGKQQRSLPHKGISRKEHISGK